MSEVLLEVEGLNAFYGATQVLHLGGINQHGYPFGGAATEALAGGGGATTFWIATRNVATVLPASALIRMYARPRATQPPRYAT